MFKKAFKIVLGAMLGFCTAMLIIGIIFALLEG